MERKCHFWVIALCLSLCGGAAQSDTPSALPSAADSYNDAGFRAGATTLSPAEAAGREIWYKATAGNARFHTYTFQQRLGVRRRCEVLCRTGRGWPLMTGPMLTKTCPPSF